MRNAVIMMTANPTEDVGADSPPSAPSGRFGGHPRTGRVTGLLPAKARSQRRCERTWGMGRRRRFLLRSIRPSDIDRNLYISPLDFCPVLGYYVTQNENQRQDHGLHFPARVDPFG
jgi:hypothetical protein